MTRRQLYEHTLLELNKNQAPSLLLEDYNYYIMKAIHSVISLKYSNNEVDQKLDDDLKVLRKPFSVSEKTKITTYGVDKEAYQFNLPSDYLHLLNCIAVYKVKTPIGCYKLNDTITYGCTRMTSQLEPVFSWNYYIKPKWFKPYSFLNTDTNKTINQPNIEDEKPVDNSVRNNVKLTGVEIHVGTIPGYLQLDSITGRYFKIPESVYLTQDDIDSDYDNTPYLEFPDYLCYEIISTLVTLLLEHDANPRLQTNVMLASASNRVNK